jgi:hypothetical protein
VPCGAQLVVGPAQHDRGPDLRHGRVADHIAKGVG